MWKIATHKFGDFYIKKRDLTNLVHKQNEIENIVILIMTNKFVKSRFLM